MNIIIFGLCDPRLPEGGNIVYVGQSSDPQKTIQNLLRHTANKRLRSWIDELAQDFPEGLVLQYGEKDTPIGPGADGRLYMKWIKLEEHYRADTFSGGDVVLQFKAPVSMIIEELKAEGHPLLNGMRGRPKKDNPDAASG